MMNANNYGIVEVDGREYYLTEAAYLDGNGEDTYYTAAAIDGSGNSYQVYWLYPDMGMEMEEDRCDWSTADEVRLLEEA